MLPAVTKTAAARTAVAAVTALGLALASAAPVQAWGKNEQNFLKGVAATLIVTEIIRHQRAKAAPRAPAAEPVYVPSYPAQSASAAAAEAFRAYSPAARRAIQQTLRDAGYYAGALDGVWGPRTWAAVRAYASDAGLSSNLGTYAGSVRVMNSLIG